MAKEKVTSSDKGVVAGSSPAVDRKVNVAQLVEHKNTLSAYSSAYFEIMQVAKVEVTST